MRRLMLTSLFTLGFLLTLSLSPQEVHACSGNFHWIPPLDIAIELSDLVVSGHFVELDDAQTNGVFRVERYLMGGSGPEYLTLAMNDVVVVRRRLHGIEGDGYACSYILADFALERPMVIFLKRRTDGSYGADPGRVTYFNFETPETTIKLIMEDVEDSEDVEFREFTQSQLEEFLFEQLQEPATTPEPDHPYPLKSPILIRTDEKNNYVLPVDRSAPVEVTADEVFDLRRDQSFCSIWPCLVYSPDGARRISSSLGYNGYSLVGDRIHVAPSNGWFALWKENRLEIFSLDIPTFSGSSAAKRTHFIPISPKSHLFPSTWRPDGKYLAFSDIRGLWLWDVSLPESQPERIIPAYRDRVPVARYFSPRGRYLAVTEGNRRFTLDLESGGRLPDGLVSPGEERLVAFDTTAEDIIEYEVYELGPPWETETYYTYGDYTFQQIEWFSDRELIISGCGHGYMRIDEPTVDKDYCYTYIRSVVVVGGNYFPWDDWLTFDTRYSAAFDYNQQEEMMLRLIGPQRIAIGHDEIDLTGLIEGDIVEVMWLPSLFYYED